MKYKVGDIITEKHNPYKQFWKIINIDEENKIYLYSYQLRHNLVTGFSKNTLKQHIILNEIEKKLYLT